MNRTVRFRMGVLVLMLLLGAGAAQALPEVAVSPAERWAANPLTELWSWMTSWLESVVTGEKETGGAGGEQTSKEEDGGLYIDPNG